MTKSLKKSSGTVLYTIGSYGVWGFGLRLVILGLVINGQERDNT